MNRVYRVTLAELDGTVLEAWTVSLNPEKLEADFCLDPDENEYQGCELVEAIEARILSVEVE